MPDPVPPPEYVTPDGYVVSRSFVAVFVPVGIGLKVPVGSKIPVGLMMLGLRMPLGMRIPLGPNVIAVVEDGVAADDNEDESSRLLGSTTRTGGSLVKPVVVGPVGEVSVFGPCPRVVVTPFPTITVLEMMTVLTTSVSVLEGNTAAPLPVSAPRISLRKSRFSDELDWEAVPSMLLET